MMLSLTREEIHEKKIRTPKYMQYTRVCDRIKSFQKWTEKFAHQPNKLAEAGFFYLGKHIDYYFNVSLTSFFFFFYNLEQVKKIWWDAFGAEEDCEIGFHVMNLGMNTQNSFHTVNTFN